MADIMIKNITGTQAFRENTSLFSILPSNLLV
jgi:hypothetical protein